jgi:protein TonB
MSNKQLSYKKPSNDLRLKYKRVLEISFIITLILMCCLFFSFKNHKSNASLLTTVDNISFITVDIPKTIQKEPRPRPLRPTIPLPVEVEEPFDYVTINYENINLAEIFSESSPPEQTEEEEFPFYAVSEKPYIIKRVQPIYPALARQAGIEGEVVITVLIDTKGNVEKIKILKSVPMLDEAAVAAAKQLKFKPGKQRDKFVKVWMSIPFRFNLK